MNPITPKLKKRKLEQKAPPKGLIDFAASDPAFQKAISLKEPPKDWSIFTESDTKSLVDTFSEVLKDSPKGTLTVKTADTHFVLHIADLEGTLTLAKLEHAAKELHKKYAVGHVQLNLTRRFIDVRFKARTHSSTEISNVLFVGECMLYAGISKKIKHATNPMDWGLLSVLVTHCENLMGAETPENLEFVINTPEGQTLLGDTGPVENKEGKRSNYEFHVTGYTTVDTAQLRSFNHVLPFHAHAPKVNWSAGRITIFVEPYSRPLVGRVLGVFDDVGRS